MCKRHSFIITRAGKILDGMGITDSHTEIRELHGLKHTDDTVNAYEWQPPKGWPETDWFEGLTKDTEVFELKSSHLTAMERHVKSLYPTVKEWDAGDKLIISDVDRNLANELIAMSDYITVPETKLPNGLIVPAFQVAKFPMSRADKAIPVSNGKDAPWHSLTYHAARNISARVGLNLLKETQALAIAWNIHGQDINWTGGKVGEGDLIQGIRNGNLRKAQVGNYESPDPTERSWHELSNGDRIYHFAGNIYSWIEDDVQGGKDGVVAKPFAKDSVSLMAPFGSGERGIGWRPNAGANWSGCALMRGGCWGSESSAGVFRLDGCGPGDRCGDVGFRCTRSL